METLNNRPNLQRADFNETSMEWLLAFETAKDDIVPYKTLHIVVNIAGDKCMAKFAVHHGSLCVIMTESLSLAIKKYNSLEVKYVSSFMEYEETN